MSKQSNPDPSTTPDVKTSTVDVQKIDDVAAQIKVRHLPLMYTDEKPWNGGQDRGPSPLEYVLAGLGA